jgi:hypothetical protein
MRLREPDLPLDPDFERRLEAIDRALAGQRVDPDLEELAMLSVEIRGARPEPSAEAEGMLDELAASGFPPRESDRVGRMSRRVADASAGLRRKGARRLVPAFGAAAVLLVAVGVGVSESGIFAGGANSVRAPAAREQADGARNAPSLDLRAAKKSRPALPTVQDQAGATDQLTQHLPSRASAPAASPLLGGLAGPAKRQVARNVDLELSAAPDHFRDAADGVLDVVRVHHGFVVSSQVSGGDPGVRGAERGHANFELRIPAGELSGSMGDLSNLGHVVSRSDGTHDVTKRFVSARKRIDALTASRDRLLRQLGTAATITEKQSLRARLRIVEARLSAAHRDLAKVQQRVHLVPVSVAITADAHASSGGAWTIGDAFHDAGRVLTVAAGVALVGGAALLPLALLIGLTAAGWRGWVRRQRARALDAPAG